MRLRAQPKPVLRLSRKVLIGGGAVVAVVIGAALAYAMSPPKPKATPAQAADTAPVHTPAATEALGTLPKDYSAVPKLGPPLPGDLGRPMLAASEAAPTAVEGATTGTVAMSTPAVASPSPPPQMDSHAAQARAAARSSQLFFAQTGENDPATLATSTSQSNAPLSTWPVAATAATETKSEPDRKLSFLESGSDGQITSDARLAGPTSPYTLLTGSVVPAALITGLSSDIPGQVLAQVTQDVRDSLTGRYVLIPKGARLIGQYDNTVTFGQARVLLVWSRLILPNGRSLVLEKLSAGDARGYAGLKDKVDNHWGAIINAAALSTLLGIGAQSGSTDDDTALVRALRDGAADTINRAGQRIVERQLSVQPTLTIRAGMPVRVILSRDLVLEPYGD
jgi:type IV secretion system protein VirB10